MGAIFSVFSCIGYVTKKYQNYHVRMMALYCCCIRFDDSEVLGGRPYGGCAILWRANINMHSVIMVNTHSTRLCAARFESDNKIPGFS